jgi:16S rRNA (adenine1518-N6/adenine1519-N6)-dimethyltransferase
LPPQAFTPPPKVTSSVVSLVPRQEIEPAQIGALSAITAAAFGQRRKMLRRSLASLGGEALLERCGIAPTLRGEALGVAEFCALARAYAETMPGAPHA